MYYEQRSNSEAQINNGGNISCSVQTTLAGGSSSLFSYSSSAATAVAQTAAANADAAVAAAVAAEDAAANCNTRGSLF